MTARFASVAAMAVALTACACHKTSPMENTPSKPAPVRKSVPVSSVHLDNTAGRQVQIIRWNRSASWTPVKVSSDYSQIGTALVSRDKMGDRLLVASPSAGYQIARIRVDCTRNGFIVEQARRVASDTEQAGGGKDDRSLLPRIAPDEIARFCKGGAAGTMTGTPASLVPQLRDQNAKATTRPEPSAAERAAAWRKYQAENPATRK